MFIMIIVYYDVDLTDFVVLEENRSCMEQEMNRCQVAVKEAEQLINGLQDESNATQQKLVRSLDLQNRWKERSEALVEQLQAEQNRAIIAEQTSTKYLHKSQTLKAHYQQVIHCCLNKIEQDELFEN